MLKQTYYSRFFVSIIIVTGPSLTNSTSIMAPNSPLSTSPTWQIEYDFHRSRQKKCSFTLKSRQKKCNFAMKSRQ